MLCEIAVRSLIVDFLKKKIEVLSNDYFVAAYEGQFSKQSYVNLFSQPALCFSVLIKFPYV